MSYTRDELLSIRNAPLEKFQEINQSLIESLQAGNPLTLSEAKFICLGLKTIYNDEGENPLNAEEFSQCKDFLFWEKYLLYWGDHEGWGAIEDRPGSLIEVAQKAKDVHFLTEHYEQWKEIVLVDNQGTAFLQTVANETKRLIKEITAFSKQMGEGSNRQKYIEKALTLHSKYVYLQISEYYEELNASEEVFELCNKKVIVDYFAYAHILFGHFAEGIKFGRPGKSYHSAGAIDFRNIPKVILGILTVYSQQNFCADFNKQNIFFNLNGKDYAMWFRPITRSVKGKEQEAILRVQSLYPIEQGRDVSNLQKMQKTTVDERLAFYLPKPI